MLKNALAVFVFTFVVFLIFLPSYSKMQDIRQKEQEYTAQVEDLEGKIKQLEEERRRLKEDPEYLEKVAREKMGLIRENEVIFKITPSQEGDKLYKDE